MRKFSLLIALALLITVGGVYATWIYTGSDIADITGNRAVTMGNVEFEGSAGSYFVDTAGLVMKIEPEDNTATGAEVAKRFKATLKMTGQIVITFTPNELADPDVVANGVATKFWFTPSNLSWTYGGNTIITVNNMEHAIALANETGSPEHQWVKQGNSFTCTITAAQLESHNIFTLGNFSLTNKTEYDEFDTALEAGQIVIHISDLPLNP